MREIVISIVAAVTRKFTHGRNVDILAPSFVLYFPKIV